MADTPNMADTPKPKRRRVLRIVLFLSLALNLMVVGLVAGAVLRDGPPGPPPRPGGEDVAMPYIRALTDDQRREIRRELRREVQGDRDAARAVRRAVSDGYRDAVALMRADPFDADALEAVLAEQASRSADVRARGQAVLSRFLQDMTPEQRAAYASRLEEVLEKAAFRRDKYRDGGGRDRDWGKGGDHGRDGRD